MKKDYRKPYTKAVMIQQLSILASTNPDVHDEEGGPEQFSRRRGGRGRANWEEEEWEDEEDV